MSSVHRARFWFRSMIAKTPESLEAWLKTIYQKLWLTCFNHHKIARPWQWLSCHIVLVAAILSRYTNIYSNVDYSNVDLQPWQLRKWMFGNSGWIDYCRECPVCPLNPFHHPTDRIQRLFGPKGSLSMVHHGASCRGFHEKSWEWVQSVSGCCMGFVVFFVVVSGPIWEAQLPAAANCMFEIVWIPLISIWLQVKM